MTTAADIRQALHGRVFSLADEKRCQADIEVALLAAGFAFERERRLSRTDVIDFLVGDVGVEVKIKGARRAIYYQLERYAAHAEIAELLLVTNVPMGLPAVIGGKPAFYLSMAMAWL